MLALVVALASYALDCGAMTTSEQAMQCCGSMPCSPQGRNDQNCCNKMPTMRGPFVKPPALQVSFATTLAVLPINNQPLITTSELPETSSSAQPNFSPPAVSPLRI